MKTRTGFVSNSSSSSFIVVFDKKPKSAKELQKAMFGTEKSLAAYGDPVSTQKAARDVFKKLKGQKPLTLGQAILLLEDGVVEWGEKSVYPPPYDSKEPDESKEDRLLVQAELANKSKGKLMFLFKYSDNNDVFETAMEHGDIFKNFDHFVISHH